MTFAPDIGYNSIALVILRFIIPSLHCFFIILTAADYFLDERSVSHGWWIRISFQNKRQEPRPAVLFKSPVPSEDIQLIKHWIIQLPGNLPASVRELPLRFPIQTNCPLSVAFLNHEMIGRPGFGENQVDLHMVCLLADVGPPKAIAGQKTPADIPLYIELIDIPPVLNLPQGEQD